MERTFYQDMRLAEDWDWWHAGRRRVLARILRRGLSSCGLPVSGAEILDVGCGTGGTTAFLGREHRVIGCDVATDAVRLARGRGLALVRASAESLPFSPASFDVVLALDVLEHHDDDSAVALEARRVLRPGGLLLVTVPCFSFLWGPHDVLSHHRRRYVLPSLRASLERGGLRILRASYFNALLFPAAAMVQLVRRLLRRGRPVEPRSDMADPQSTPRLFNAMLRETFAAEGPWLSRFPLPFGISAFALARRPLEGAA
jgi:SAM-dependent methyltransferase